MSQAQHDQQGAAEQQWREENMLQINVSDHVEKKNGLSYLSWAWAWAEVLKIDPEATWECAEYGSPEGKIPCMLLPDGTAMVKTFVTIKGRTKTCILPVMDNRNKAIAGPNAFQINTAIMRCMTKTISMHGLGLYIYAGEDLPEGEAPAKPAGQQSVRHAVRDGIGEDLPQDWKDYLQSAANIVTDMVQAGEVAAAVAKIDAEKLEADQRTYLESQMDSKTRSAIKQAQQAARKAA